MWMWLVAAQEDMNSGDPDAIWDLRLTLALVASDDQVGIALAEASEKMTRFERQPNGLYVEIKA